jgi:hypothetical protein
MLSCSDNDDFNGMNAENNLIETDNIQNVDLTEADIDALLFMLEEEKLARDTYKFLNDLWNINQLSNIGNSEQSHMDAIINLLDANMIEYSILPNGEFFDSELQALFDQFAIEGSLSTENALQIGATIEDLDIVDLQEYIDATSNSALKDVFSSLQCGSRNHLRSFISSIENTGNSYTPQFLTQEEYNLIISSNHEQCNQ